MPSFCTRPVRESPRKDRVPTVVWCFLGMIQAATAYLGFEDYFESAASAACESLKHEWFDGVVYAMSRGTPEHARLAFRAGRALANALPSTCEVYSGDVMLFIASANLATYADVSVVCGALEASTVRKKGKSLGTAVINPAIVVEVLVPGPQSTERYDRERKFQAYKGIASLEVYVLVSQDTRKVEIFRRESAFRGETAMARESFVVHGATISVDDIYGPSTG